MKSQVQRHTYLTIALTGILVAAVIAEDWWKFGWANLTNLTASAVQR